MAAMSTTAKRINLMFLSPTVYTARNGRIASSNRTRER